MKKDHADMAMFVHQAMAQALIDNGVDTVFGLIGDANLFLVDHFVRSGNGTYVSAANEAGALVMGLGYASVSDKVGVVTVTHGPALTNTLTGLVEGVKGRTPLLLICGDTPVEDTHNLQNVAQRELIVATGAGFEQVRSPRTAVEDLAIALRRAKVERRPVALNVPAEFAWEEVEYIPAIAMEPPPPGLFQDEDVFGEAVGMLASARKPIIVAGRGARRENARRALVRLGERTGALLATTLKAKDLFRGESYNLGVFGTLSSPIAVEEILASDCILAFGAGLNLNTTSQGAFLEGKRVIQCDADPAAIGRYVTPSAAIVGDAALAADHIVALLDMAEIAPPGYRDPQLDQRLRAYRPEFTDVSTAETIDLRLALDALNGAVPENRVLVTDGGRFLLEAWRYLDAKTPDDFVYSVNFGSIGLGVSAAIGAAYAAPDRPVLLAAGDGGFMLGGLTEFNTAVRHRRDLIVLLFNDGAYGAEEVQFRNRGMDASLALLDWPDFASVATALGGQGVTVRNVADLAKAKDAILKRDRPLLIDIRLDPAAVPDPHY